MKSNKALVPLDTSQRSAQEDDFSSRVDARIIGQAEAKAAALRAYRNFLNPLRDPDRPIYIIHAIGKSRTGKTLTAEVLAELLHGDKNALVRIHCGAYKEKHRISQLLGAPPGYLGYRDGSSGSDGRGGKKPPVKLDSSAKLSRQNLVASRHGSTVPVSIVLVDECEKLIEELEEVFLSIFDKGEVDMGNNEPTDFRDCIFVLTSNLASDEVEKLGKAGLGFQAQSSTPTEEQVKSTVMRALERRYKPEFLNRIDETVIFAPHTPEQIRQIVDMEIGLVEKRIQSRLPAELQFKLDVQASARQFILERSQNGVSDLKRTIQRYVLDPISSELVKHTIKLGDVLVVKHQSGKNQLSFYRIEGVSEACTGVAKPDVPVTTGPNGTAATPPSTGNRVDLKAPDKRQTYELQVQAEDMAQLAEIVRPLTRDMRRLFGMLLLQTNTTWTRPFVYKAWVLASPAQIELFKRKYPDVEATLKKEGTPKAS